MLSPYELAAVSPPLSQQSPRDTARHPDDHDDVGDPVEIAFGHRRTAQGGGNATAEEVGQPTAFSLVQQHEQHDQHARGDQNNLERNHHGSLTAFGKSCSTSKAYDVSGPRPPTTPLMG